MRVLLISPHFPPANAADMQRVRLVLPYLNGEGVEAEVLSVESTQVAAPQDEWLAGSLPSRVPVHRVRALGLVWGRLPGLGTLTFRALGALRRRGDALLRNGSFDLVYFSTTQFGLHVLGPRWKRKFGVPFVMDYQDPWVSDYYREHPEVVPPGGRLKYGISSWLSRKQEPRVLRHCSGITSVSAAYPQQLAKRYPWLEVRDHGAGGRTQETKDKVRNTAIRPPPTAVHSLPSLVLPFPGDVRDFERVKRDDIRQTVFDPNDGLKHWVYVGRGGADMALACKGLFSALQSTLNSQPLVSAEPRGDAGSTRNSLRLHFIGTSYAAAGQGLKTIEPLAAEFGLERQVIEHPDRIPYSETLRCLLDADALIIPGSDDPGYTASKIYPYLVAGKPLLAIFHEASSVVSLIREVAGGTVIQFAAGESPDSIAGRISSEWIATGGPRRVTPLDEVAFTPHTACAQAGCLAEFWQECLKRDF